MNLAGRPNFAIIFQSLSRLTVSNALVRSTKVMKRSTFCSWHFYWCCLAVKIMSIVPLSFLNPYWLSGRSPDYSRCSFNLFNRIQYDSSEDLPSYWQLRGASMIVTDLSIPFIYFFIFLFFFIFSFIYLFILFYFFFFNFYFFFFELVDNCCMLEFLRDSIFLHIIWNSSVSFSVTGGPSAL